MTFSQASFDLRLEWGEAGVRELAPHCDVVVIVDVLSFSTCVDVAVGRSARVFPYPRYDAGAEALAASLGALLASPRRGSGYSLSPHSLLDIPPGTRLVLPSPNGSALSLAAGDTPVLAGCLRNARAVAAAARGYGRRVAVIAAGERWPGGSLRPAFEDLVGAGAIIAHLPGAPSPEARAARAAYTDARPDLPRLLAACGSGREIIERGFAQDVALAAQIDVSTAAPALVEGAFVDRAV